MSTIPLDSEKLFSAIEAIAKNEANSYAKDVDQNARFPIETISALKEAKAFSAGLSESFGGQGLSTLEQSRLCRSLAKSCSASAMILGMHFIKCNSISDWASDSEFFKNYLNDVHKEQRLIASMTSEEGVGGDLRQSNAAIMYSDDTFFIEKKSPCLSYVQQADDILLTCRVNELAPHSDQKLVLLKSSQMERTITKPWDSLGMRGTCSHGCEISGTANTDQIIEQDFGTIASQSMIPDAHIIWAGIWLGIAENAFQKARKLSRKKFVKQAASSSSSAYLLNEMYKKILALDGQTETLGKKYHSYKASCNAKALRSIAFSIEVNALKLNASELARDVCLQALEVCGIAGYLNDNDMSVGRNIRDVLSASVMVSNERLVEINASRLMV